MSREIVQLVGLPGSGKTELSKYISDTYGFTPILVSDFIRNWAHICGVELSKRKDYMDTHAQMLSDLGKFAVTEAILDSPSDRICVDGLRVPAHSEFLHTYGPIIALDCPIDIRYQRMKLRKGPLDKVSLDEVLRDEELESHNNDPFSQNTQAVMELADFHIDSSQPLPWVTNAVDKFMVPLIADQSF